jgi:formylglycine-generating enzyme required for sulfatase activity
MKLKIKTLSLVWLMMFGVSSFANNITVSNVSLEGQDFTGHFCYVEFDLSWENSWRTSSIPFNWDAAWVFVKYQVADGPWYHAALHGSGHISVAGATIDVPSDSTGVFIYRSADGSGTITWEDIRLRWDYGENGVADDAVIRVAVLAIEMVYVPQGAFYLGDGSSTYTYYEYPTLANPYQVTSDPITFDISGGDLWANGGIGFGMQGTTFPSTFPTGYEAFYCMKYELSQEKYAYFLEFLTRPQQNNRVYSDISGNTVSAVYVMSNTTSMSHRNAIVCASSGLGTTDPIGFSHNYQIGGDDGQNIACNFVTYMDMAAYADWAGLRPMTGFEYEKACRGPNMPVADELAWGNTLVSSTTYTMGNEGGPDEMIGNPSTIYGNMMYASTSGNFGGPGRCGIFAASAITPTRMEAGASYYGIMEMSGNLLEFIVAPFCQAGRSFTGLHGDGELTTDGYANTDYWPGINGNNQSNTPNQAYSTDGVTSAAGIARRSSYFGGNLSDQTVSCRTDAATFITQDITHFEGNGIRLVRTAP